MAKYEVYIKRTYLSNRNSLPIETYYTPDMAIEKAKELSRTSKEIEDWDFDWYTDAKPKKKTIYDDAFVLYRGDKSNVHGVAVKGKYYIAVNCKRCKNTGQDTQNYGENCRACNGASWRHI